MDSKFNNKIVVLNEKDRQTGCGKALLLYTVAFIVLYIGVFFLFISDNRSFIRYLGNTDIFVQRYAFVFELKRFLANLFAGGHFNTWDWTLGTGMDGFAFNGSNILNPFAYIPLLVPGKYVDVAFSVAVALRIYCSGSTYILFAKKIDLSDMQSITGAVMYAFSPWVITAALGQPTFLITTVLMPILMLGVEKVIRKESPLLFMLTVGYTVITTFYFSYVLGLMTLIYYVVRKLTAYKSNSIADGARNFFSFVGYGLVGIMISGVTLFITLLKFSKYTTTTGSTVNPFFTVTQYLRLPMKISLWSSFFQFSSHVGIASLGLVMIPAILYCAYRKRSNAVMTVLLAFFVLFPIFHSAFNYFSYPAGRWMFSLAFFFSLASVECLDASVLVNRRLKIATVSFFALYVIYLLWISKILTGQERLQIFLYCITAVLIIVIVIWAYRNKGETDPASVNSKAVEKGVFVLVSICLIACYNIKLQEMYPSFLHFGEAYTKSNSSVQRIGQKIDDDGFYRITQHKESVKYSQLPRTSNDAVFFGNRSNYALITGMDARCFLLNKYIGNNQGYFNRVRIDSNDERFGLELLQGSKYFIGNDHKGDMSLSDYACYGFEKDRVIDDVELLKNRFFIGLGCVFDHYIKESEWMKLNYAERELALLRAVLLTSDEKGPYGMKELKATDIQGIVSELPLEIKRNGNHLDIDAVNDDNHQIIMTIRNANSPDDTSFSARVKNEKVVKNLRNTKTSARGFTDIEDLTVNLGYGKGATENLQVDFKVEEGECQYDDIILHAVPLEEYTSDAELLEKSSIDTEIFENDYIKGSVTAESDGMLFLSVPHNKGWQVYIDGKKAELKNVDFMFSAVDVTKGKHTVELNYHTYGLLPGLGISLCGLLICLLITRRVTKNNKKQEELY